MTFTSDIEKEVLEHLGEAWLAFLKLPCKHGNDIAEFRLHTHALQNIIAWHVARRADPETWGVGLPVEKEPT